MLNNKIAFVGWNPFQFHYIEPILKKMPNATFVLEVRNNKNTLNPEVLQCYKNRIIMQDKHDMGQLDGQFDLIVCQTPFSQIFKILNTPIVMLQYGYAKEPHNYGAWRALADVNLVYGEYAAQKIRYYSPIEVTGNPSYDGVLSEDFQHSSYEKLGDKLSKHKKTVLYAPTWGDLSSLDEYLEAVCQLSQYYNILVKVHHNTNLLEVSRWQKISKASNVSILGANDNLLEAIAVSDVVISDYSGAIFDAMFCNKPIILLNIRNEQQSPKLDAFSLEYTHRAQIGYQVNSKHDLKGVVKNIFMVDSERQCTLDMRSQLFLNTDSAVNKIMVALNKAMEQKYTLTQHQLYIRQSIRQLYEAEYALSQYKKNKGLIRTLKSKLW